MNEQEKRSSKKNRWVLLLSAFYLIILLVTIFFVSRMFADNGAIPNPDNPQTGVSIKNSQSGLINESGKQQADNPSVKVNSVFSNSLLSFDVPIDCVVNIEKRYAVEGDYSEDFKNDVIINIPDSIGKLALRFEPVTKLGLGAIAPINKLEDYYANAERSRFLAIEDFDIGNKSGKLISWIDDAGEKYQENGAFIVMTDAPYNLYFSAFVESDKSATNPPTHKEVFFSPEVQHILRSLHFSYE